MTSEQQPRDAFAVAIRAKIAAWTAVLDSYSAAVALDGPLSEAVSPTDHRQTRPAASTPVRSMDLPVGVFRDKSIKDAIAIYLAAGHRKQTNKEIATGLKQGGIATTSSTFESTVATALHRMKAEGTVLRFPDGWDLASSYPDSLRGRLNKDSKDSKAKGSLRRGKKARAVKAPKTQENDKTTQILELITANSDAKSVADLVSWLDALNMSVSRDYVRVVTKRLKARGLIDIRDGKFYPPSSA